MLAPTAPFRRLQPGEASQVLAPLSPVILVDRRKLETLGIPRCSLPGTAWMLLFWKAAAAGWKSYAVGGAGELPRLPDAPVEETAFLLSVLSNPELRQLAPREPDLAGGNIAFAASARHQRRSSAGRPKVLLVSPFLPYPLAHGGAVRIYNLCRALADRVDFILIAIREQHDVVDYAKLREVFREVCVVDLDESASGDKRLPRQVRHSPSRSLRALIAKLAERERPNLLQIEYTHLAGFRDAAPDVPALLVEHDITFSLYRQLAESRRTRQARDEYGRWRAFERHWLNAFDGVWTVSEEDRQLAIQEGSRPGSTVAIPNGVDVRRFTPCDESTPDPEILYVGSFRHLPNVLGFEKLREEIMPRVWKRHPRARLHVVAGPRYEEFWRKGREDARISIHGFVEDLRPLYARAAVVAAPLAVSAGTNIKVLEAMACGKAIVTTSVGCAGLGLRDEALICDRWPEFAEAISELLASAGRRRSLGTRARRTAEERFSWTAIAARAYECYCFKIASSSAMR
jgi:glycosyltransferase involved in cell wall biosynthesis